MKFRFISAVSITAVAACAVFACSSNKDSGGTGGACQNYASAYVSYAARCTGGFDPSQEGALTSRYAQLCTGVLALPGTTDISGQLNTCAASLNNAPCNASINQLDGCDVQTTGTLADGTACASGGECKSGDCKIDESSGAADGGVSLCGTCAPAIADGADCSQGGTCVVGDTCTFNTADGGFSGTCTKKGAPGDVGATCASTDDCKAPNHCVFGTNETGTCTAPVASGGSCQTNTDCGSGLACAGQTSRTCGQPVAEGGTCYANECAPSLSCDFTSNKCTKIKFGAAGAACDGETLRCTQGECKISATSGGGGGGSTATGVCPTIIADGQPCDEGSDTASCDEFASCVNGTCVLVPAACK